MFSFILINIINSWEHFYRTKRNERRTNQHRGIIHTRWRREKWKKKSSGKSIKMNKKNALFCFRINELLLQIHKCMQFFFPCIMCNNDNDDPITYLPTIDNYLLVKLRLYIICIYMEYIFCWYTHTLFYQYFYLNNLSTFSAFAGCMKKKVACCDRLKCETRLSSDLWAID